MSSIMNVALSGLSSASKRIEVSANNVANQNSTATNVNGVTTNKPYMPQDVVQISLGSGGVRPEVRDATNPVVKFYDAESTQADENGFVSAPNVDLAEEMVNMQMATYDFKANLKAIKAADRVEQYLLDMLS